MEIKKIIYLNVLVATLLLAMQTVAVTYHPSPSPFTEKTLELKKIEGPVMVGGPLEVQDQPIKRDVWGVPKTPTSALGTDILVSGFPEYEGNPALTLDNQGNLVLAYEYGVDFLEQDIFFTHSTDRGQTWDDPIYFQIDGIESHPAIDFAGTVAGTGLGYATFLSSEDQGAHTTLVDMVNILDPETWEGSTWGWDDNGFSDFSSCDIVAYGEPIPIGTVEAEHFVAAYTGSFSGVSGYPDCVQVPFYMINVGEGSGWIYWFYYNHSANAKMDIDKPAHIIYYAFQWDNNGNQDIIVLSTDIDNVGQTEDEGGWGDGMGEDRKYQVTGTANTINPALAADNNHVYLIMETDQAGNQDIVCYYSSDGGATYQMSAIADTEVDEVYPSVYADGETALCLFIKNNNLYSASSHDGGASWETSSYSLNDVSGSVVTQYGSADTWGNYGVWTDTRNGNGDIYLDETTAAPLLLIKEISGGFGVKARVENSGTATATDVHWTITIDAPLVFLGRETTGTIDTLEAQSEEYIKSGLALGFGPCTITVTVDTTSATANGFLLGPFILGVS